MKLELKSGDLRLERGQVIKVQDGVGSTVCALQGAVWITEDNQPKDIVLEEGQCYQLRNPGLAILHPLSGSAAVSIH